MGVSIMMSPGVPGRNRGKQVNITPGLRSRAADVLRQEFSNSPITLTAAEDLGKLALMASATRVCIFDDKDNFWKIIADAVAMHDAVTITLEY